MSTDSKDDAVCKETLDDERFVLVFSVDLPTLQQTTSYKVSLATWYSYISSPRLFLHEGISDWIPHLGAKLTYQTDLVRLIDELKMPRVICNMLKNSMKKILRELNAWATHLYSTMFPECSLLRIDSNWCVWMANGEIDYRKSAENALDACAELNDLQKSFLMEYYRMEDRFALLLLELPSIRVKEFHDYYKKNILSKKMKSRFSLHVGMKYRGCQNCKEANKKYFQYLESKSTNKVYTLQLKLLDCEDARSWLIVDRVLHSSGYNLNHLESLCVQHRVMYSLIYLKFTTFSFRLWSHFKRHIKDVTFSKIIQTMLYKSIDDEEKMKLLSDVWNTANEGHIDYTLQYTSMFIFNKFTNPEYIPPCSAAYEFLRDYISAIRSRGYWVDVMFRAPAPLISLFVFFADNDILTKMIESYPLDSRQISNKTLKNNVLQCNHFRNCCVRMVSWGNFDHLNAKLNWLYSEDERPRTAVCSWKIDFLRYTLEINTEDFLWRVFEKWDKLFDFIDETCAEDTTLATELKRRFFQKVTRMELTSSLYCHIFNDVKQIAESIFPIEQLYEYKINCLRELNIKVQQSTCWWYEYVNDEQSFKKFVDLCDWCCGNDPTKISQFKEECGDVIASFLDSFTRANDSMYVRQRYDILSIY